MNLLFSFLDPEHTHSTLLAGYFSKVSSYSISKGYAVEQKKFDHENVLPLFLSSLYPLFLFFFWRCFLICIQLFKWLITKLLIVLSSLSFSFNTCHYLCFNWEHIAINFELQLSILPFVGEYLVFYYSVFLFGLFNQQL